MIHLIQVFGQRSHVQVADSNHVLVLRGRPRPLSSCRRKVAGPAGLSQSQPGRPRQTPSGDGWRLRCRWDRRALFEYTRLRLADTLSIAGIGCRVVLYTIGRCPSTGSSGISVTAPLRRCALPSRGGLRAQQRDQTTVVIQAALAFHVYSQTSAPGLNDRLVSPPVTVYTATACPWTAGGR